MPGAFLQVNGLNKKMWRLIAIGGMALMLVSLVMIVITLVQKSKTEALYAQTLEAYTISAPGSAQGAGASAKGGSGNAGKEGGSPPLAGGSGETGGTSSGAGDGETVAEEAPPEIPWEELLEVDFEKLCAVSPDVCGWIYFENEKISYPVLWSGDNETYLRRSYDGQELKSGSIFVDGRCSSDFSGRNTIVYGHNMHDLSMFGRLRYYLQDASYYETHPYFQILTPDGKCRYEIFACYVADASDNKGPYVRDFADEKVFRSFLEENVRKSVVRADLKADEIERVVTLSTCVNDAGSRLVVMGAPVEER